jgi:hypothetical protein
MTSRERTVAELITEERLRERTARRVAEVTRKIAEMRTGDLICEACLMIRTAAERDGSFRETLCWCDVEEAHEV